MKKIILSCVAATSALPTLGFAQGVPSGQLPSQARAGQCFGRVLVPATYRNEAMSVVTREAYEQVQVSDPVFRADQTSVATSDAYKRYEVSEPTFRTEAQTIVTRPAHERLVASPAVLGTRSETIMIREPRLVWRAGSNLSGVRRMDSATGEIFCLVEEAAVTQTVTRTVQTQPARISRQAVPAETTTIQRRVLATPASVREINVPGTFQNVTVHTLVNQAGERRSMVPEQTSTVNRQVIETGERYEWVPVVCETTPTGVVSVTAAQRALAAKGLYRGAIDGVVGSRTTAAIREYQRLNRLPGNGSLTIETARHLGL
jgi:Putative peptidoglycan binding domain